MCAVEVPFDGSAPPNLRLNWFTVSTLTALIDCNKSGPISAEPIRS